MLYAVFIAVCLIGTPVDKCNRHTAADWVAAPEMQMGLGMCMKHGLEYAAETDLVTTGVYPKVFCTTGGSTPQNNAG